MVTAYMPLLRRSRPFKVTDSCTSRKFIYDFLLVINTNLAPISCGFRDITLIGPKSLYSATAVVFNSPDGGVPLSVKFHRDVSGWQRYQMA